MEPYKIVKEQLDKDNFKNLLKEDNDQATIELLLPIENSSTIVNTIIVFNKKKPIYTIIMTVPFNEKKGTKKYIHALELCNKFTASYDQIKAYIGYFDDIRFESTLRYKNFDISTLFTEVSEYLKYFEKDIINNLRN